MHPRNRHQGHYDFELLIRAYPKLVAFASTNPDGERTIDFSDPKAVQALNRALLSHFYGIENWETPAGYLCPPIPGRADYIHQVADLLGSCNGGVIPRGDSVRALDIGVGASCIYPILGHCEYGWRFVGSDIDTAALASATRVVQSNPKLSPQIELRLQASPSKIFKGLLQVKDIFDISICNPPFHASREEAQQGNRRKSKNLGRAPVLNFGGKGSELWCPGGEAGFVSRMIQESAGISERVFWFSTLVSKVTTLSTVYGALKEAKVADIKTLDMAQGQKKSRLVAWTFLSRGQQEEWRKKRWNVSA